MMRAARFYKVGEPLSVEYVPKPSPGPHEVLVATRACGICGSDRHIALEGATPVGKVPITLGHEAAGVVAAVGSEVRGLRVGTSVSVLPDIGCGECVNCVGGHGELCVARELIGIHRDGALADYFLAPAQNCIPLPPDIGFAEAAVITDAVATPYHALRMGHLRSGQSVLVVGLGALGLHAVQLARLAGASQVLAMGAHRAARERARDAGARLVLDPGEDPVGRVLDATSGLGVDLAVDLRGTSLSLDIALASLRPGGRVVVVGLSAERAQLPLAVLVRRGLSVVGAYGATRNDVEALFRLYATGRLDLSRSISSTYALDDVNAAFAQLASKAGNPFRIVVEMNAPPHGGEEGVRPPLPDVSGPSR